MALGAELHGRLVRASIDIQAGGLAPLCEAAARHGVAIVCGLNERDGEHSRGTVYNTLVFIDTDGTRDARSRRVLPISRPRAG